MFLFVHSTSLAKPGARTRVASPSAAMPTNAIASSALAPSTSNIRFQARKNGSGFPYKWVGFPIGLILLAKFMNPSLFQTTSVPPPRRASENGTEMIRKPPGEDDPFSASFTFESPSFRNSPSRKSLPPGNASSADPSYTSIPAPGFKVASPRRDSAPAVPPPPPSIDSSAPGGSSPVASASPPKAVSSVQNGRVSRNAVIFNLDKVQKLKGHVGEYLYGEITLFSRSGKLLSLIANSGPRGAGGLPEGTYSIKDYERTTEKGMYKNRGKPDAIGFKFFLDDKFDHRKDVNRWRTQLLIHPDEYDNGSIGCVAVRGTPAQLREFRDALSERIRTSPNKRFTLVVKKPTAT